MFRSFWAGGFESACHVNRAGLRLDLQSATDHERQVDGDYRRLAELGLRTARDGIRWPLVDRGQGRYDFSSLAPMVRAAARADVEIVWTLCHYGWPDDLDVFSPEFPERFGRYCGAVARFVRDESDAPVAYTPINELSFLSWAAGDAALLHPFAAGRSHELKRQFVRAALAGGEAVRLADRRARLVYVDPVIQVLAPRDRPDLEADATGYTNSQFECWDLLLGRREPELGGHAGAVDVMGINFYHANQWVHLEGRLRWEDEPRDPRWVPLHRLVARVHERYRKPLWIGETGHFGAGRARWVREIGEEVVAMRRAGLPLEGVCLYPIVDRPDWDDAGHWHNSGLWDVDRRPDGSLARVLNREYAEALRDAQGRVAEVGWGDLVSGRR